MFYLIYKITNKINGKIYIGKHQTNNINDNYMGSGKILHKAYKKYGIENFEKEILFECSSYEEMTQKEIEIVNEEFIKREDTYNIRLGGDGGWKYINDNGLSGCHKGGETFINLMKDNEYNLKFGKKVSHGLFKYYDNHTNKWLGKKHKEETKIKIGKANSLTHNGEVNSQYGTCWIFNIILRENKKINKDDLKKYLDNGWEKGRICNWNLYPVKEGDIKKEIDIKNQLEKEEHRELIEYYTKLYKIYEEVNYDFNEFVKRTKYKFSLKVFRKNVGKYIRWFL